MPFNNSLNELLLKIVCINNYIPMFYFDVITYPCPNRDILLFSSPLLVACSRQATI